MRLFEFILLISCLAQLQYLVFFKKKSKKAGILLSFIALAAVILQLSMEGYRWQMLLTYLTACMFIVTSLLQNTNPNSRSRARKLLAYILYSISLISITISGLLAVYLPVVQLPKPDGDYSVGTRTFHWIDRDRNEEFTVNPSDKRELMVQIWYPAAHQTGGKTSSVFPKEKSAFDQYIQAYASQLRIPSMFLDYWKFYKSNSYEDLTILPAKKAYPIIIISHGEGTGRILHTSQAEYLASHGYLVAAIDHTYSTIATAFPDGKVTGIAPEAMANEKDIYSSGKRMGKVWDEDINYVISKLEQLNSGKENAEFKGMLDMDHIGLIGHSFGGATAFHAVQFNPKIKAGVNMDGTLYDLSLPKDKIKPFMFLRAEDFNTWTTRYREGSITDTNLKQMITSELQVMKRVLRSGGHVMYIEGTAHYNFTDFQLYSKLIKLTGMTGNIEGSRSAKIINEYVLDFMDQQMKGEGGDLVSRPNKSYPEVKFWE